MYGRYESGSIALPIGVFVYGFVRREGAPMRSLVS